MAERRPAIPAQIKREVLVEAHHRCAVCREPAYDVAHIKDWAKGGKHTFDNLIALCPNCHRREQKGEIDKASLRQYKTNLSIVNERYSPNERRLLELFAEQPEANFVDLPNAEIDLMYLLRDGLLIDTGPPGAAQGVIREIRHAGVDVTPHRYALTPEGREFVDRWVAGKQLSPSRS
jgi:hypothetical protein